MLPLLVPPSALRLTGTGWHLASPLRNVPRLTKGNLRCYFRGRRKRESHCILSFSSQASRIFCTSIHFWKSWEFDRNETGKWVCRSAPGLEQEPPAEVTYMCHECFVDGALWVTASALLHHLPLPNGAGEGGLTIEILETWAGPLFWSGMVQDGRHTKLHLEVQEIIPGVFEEQILKRTKIEMTEQQGMRNRNAF